ncbi:TPA: asparagine--tRNA ligase, partial [Candidatus Woesearchaeota archaeon]|nr:asparagine--tRNA ligase [Candidatus Woesearchaeota archaeon]
MAYISIQDAMDKGSGAVSCRGWVHRERGSKKIKFIVLRDSTGIIQCVLERTKFEKMWDDIDKLQVESSVMLTGEIKKDDRAPGGFEISVEKFEIVHASDKFPITKDTSIEHLADHRHLWLRSRKMTAILKIRSTVFGAIDEYFKGEGFYEYHSPIFQAV